MASKVLAVFGAGQGFGYQVARKYSQQGYKVALVARNETNLKELIKKLKEEVPTSSATPFIADLSDPKQVDSVSQSILKTYGFVDTIFVGLTPAPEWWGPATTLTVEKAKKSIDLFYFGTIGVVQNFLPSMLEKQTGAIIVGTGGYTIKPREGFSGVTPAGSAQRQFSHTLNLELKDKNIFVGTIIVDGIIIGSAFGDKIFGKDENKIIPRPQIPSVEATELGDASWEIVQTKEIERIYGKL